MLDGHHLGDHPAHGRPHHVGPVQAERIEHRNRVTCHVGQGVGDRADVLTGQRPHEQGGHVGRVSGGLAGQAGVAIVEADHEVAAAGEELAERLLPCGQLCAQAHDQQQRRVTGNSEGVVLEGYATVKGLGHRHLTSPHRSSDRAIAGTRSG